MANSIASTEPVSEINLTNPTDDFDSLQFSPLDLEYLSNDFTFADGFMADLGFDDDFDFSLDDLSFLEENDDYQGDGLNVLGDRSSDDVSRVLNSNSQSPDSVIQGCCHDSRDSGGLNSQSPNSGSPERGCCSHDSGDCRSVVDGGLHPPSPESGADSASPVASSSPHDPSDVVVEVDDQTVKVEEEKKGTCLKRKTEKEEETSNNSNNRSSKIRRSVSSNSSDSVVDEEDKKKARLMRNRESAQLSRQRKKHYVEELEDKLKSLHSVIADLNSKVSYFMAENANLRLQLSGGVCPPPPPGVYPPPTMPPMAYPWYPYPMRSHGSQVPLIPIPKLKPQAPISAPKPKKSESKKSDTKMGKTKKVASVSFLGLLFFVLLFGGLVPFVDVRYGGGREASPYTFDFAGDNGRVVAVNGHVNGSNRVGVGLHGAKPDGRHSGANGIPCKRGLSEGVESKVKQRKSGSQPLPGSDGSANKGNSSEPLVASLYVPRNDKLVKIDGNLIINSVLASEKAMASSRAASEVKNNKATVSATNKTPQTGLAIPRNLAPAYAVPSAGRSVERHPHVYRIPNERQKALNSGSRDRYKETSKPADGSLQKWFHEGLEGPIFSTGMCTEVFQFDTASPGAIVPATPAAKRSPDSAHLSKRNRRILSHLPITLPGSDFNSTEDTVRPPQNGSFVGNESVSSMVVSVLVDPREHGDGEVEGVIPQKSMSRIFVVVLMDSVKKGTLLVALLDSSFVLGFVSKPPD